MSSVKQGYIRTFTQAVVGKDETVAVMQELINQGHHYVEAERDGDSSVWHVVSKRRVMPKKKDAVESREAVEAR